jgi:hypothetical protein
MISVPTFRKHALSHDAQGVGSDGRAGDLLGSTMPLRQELESDGVGMAPDSTPGKTRVNPIDRELFSAIGDVE